MTLDKDKIVQIFDELVVVDLVQVNMEQQRDFLFDLRSL